MRGAFAMVWIGYMRNKLMSSHTRTVKTHVASSLMPLPLDRFKGGRSSACMIYHMYE